MNKQRNAKLIIAQVIGGLNIGGAEKHIVNLSNALSAKEMNACSAFFIGQKQKKESLHSQLDNRVSQTRNLIRKRSFPIGVLALAREFKKRQCNVVHTHMFWANLYGTLAARIAGVPVIVTTEHGENRWKTAQHRWLERQVISRFADQRFCVSQKILERRRNVDGIPAAQLQLMANGTVVPEVSAAGRHAAEPVIGSIGRFVKQKDFELFVDVIAALRKRGYKVRGCLVGDGPDMTKVRARVSEHGLEDIIEFPGMVTATDKWFRYFDLYAITSSEEGLPVSLLEAMSYGLPVVAADVGAISSAIRSDEEGLTVPVGDKECFVNAIARLLDDPEQAARIGQRARDRIVDEFSIEAIAARYESAYLAILKQKAG